MPLISIILRTKNEERWIGRCLRMVFKQDLKDFEVVVVDSHSTDHTLDIARKYPTKIVSIDDYKPGRAINLGVRESSGKYFVCLSAHCIPQNKLWLGNLLRNMEDEQIAGVYGRQLPFAYSSDLDKRDLLLTFGKDSRIQIKDSFFHNANSMVKRHVWEKIPFDDNATNIEDRIWGKAIIEAGYRIAYDPEATVFHYHGIHQNRDEVRAKSIVNIMETLDGINGQNSIPEGFEPHTMNIIAIFPVLGEPITISNYNLLEKCIQQVKSSELINKFVVVSENQRAQEIARKSGIDFVLRPGRLAEKDVGVEEVLQFTLNESEKEKNHYDAVLYVNYLYTFRPHDFFRKLIEKFALSGVDSLVPTLKDYQPYWMELDGKVSRCDAGFMPRKYKLPVQKGMVGLGSVTSSEFIREGRLLGDNVSLIAFDEPLYSIKASDNFSKAVILSALEKGTIAFQLLAGTIVPDKS